MQHAKGVDLMSHGSARATNEQEGKHIHDQKDWYSASRQAKRDAFRLRWARHVLDEERTQPYTHSAELVRHAQNIVALLQKNQSEDN
jgi:hypothetical protein